MCSIYRQQFIDKIKEKFVQVCEYDTKVDPVDKVVASTEKNELVFMGQSKFQGDLDSDAGGEGDLDSDAGGEGDLDSDAGGEGDLDTWTVMQVARETWTVMQVARETWTVMQVARETWTVMQVAKETWTVDAGGEGGLDSDAGGKGDLDSDAGGKGDLDSDAGGKGDLDSDAGGEGDLDSNAGAEGDLSGIERESLVDLEVKGADSDAGAEGDLESDAGAEGYLSGIERESIVDLNVQKNTDGNAGTKGSSNGVPDSSTHPGFGSGCPPKNKVLKWNELPSSLQFVLPLGDDYSYVVESYEVVGATSDSPHFNCTMRINLVTEEEAKVWIEKMSERSRCTYRTTKTVKPGQKRVKCKFVKHCQHFAKKLSPKQLENVSLLRAKKAKLHLLLNSETRKPNVHLLLRRRFKYLVNCIREKLCQSLIYLVTVVSSKLTSTITIQ